MNKKILITVIFAALAAVASYLILTNESTVNANDEQIQAAGDTESVNNGAADEPANEETDNSDDSGTSNEVSTEIREEEITENVNDVVTAQLDYKDGTYTTEETYALPNGGSHHMDITMVIENDTVTDVRMVFDGDVSGGSTAIQERFTTAMQPMVVGANLDSISLSRTGGASLTTAGFNKALAEIKVKAQI